MTRTAHAILKAIALTSVAVAAFALLIVIWIGWGLISFNPVADAMRAHGFSLEVSVAVATAMMVTPLVFAALLLALLAGGRE